MKSEKCFNSKYYFNLPGKTVVASNLILIRYIKLKSVFVCLYVGTLNALIPVQFEKKNRIIGPRVARGRPYLPYGDGAKQ